MKGSKPLLGALLTGTALPLHSPSRLRRDKLAKPPDRERADEILYLTLRAIYHFERDLYSRFGLGYQDICLLQLLKRRPELRIGEAAKALEIPLFSATRLVQRLEAEGYLERRPDESDKRAVRLLISESAQGLISEIEESSYRRIEANSADLTARQIASLVSAAENLDRILGVSKRIAEEP